MSVCMVVAFEVRLNAAFVLRGFLYLGLCAHTIPLFHALELDS